MINLGDVLWHPIFVLEVERHRLYIVSINVGVKGKYLPNLGTGKNDIVY